MRLSAELPGGPRPEIIEACRKLDITGVGFDIDQALDLATAEMVFRPFLNAGLAIVQLGCYRNLVSVDAETRRQGIADVAATMDVAGALGIETVVCGGGHRDPAVPSARRSVHPDNWSDVALDSLVDACKEIVARISPGAAPLCFEPWVITTLNNPRRIEALVRRVDHPKVAVELDVANLVTIERYYDTAGLIAECFERFGDKVLLVHLKDAILRPEPYIYHIGEAVVGDGNIDYGALLKALAAVNPRASLMAEHLKTEADAKRAIDHMRALARTLQLSLS